MTVSVRRLSRKWLYLRVGFCGVLFVSSSRLLIESYSDQDSSANSFLADHKAAPRAVGIAWLPPIPLGSEITLLSRPLFQSSRRPWSPPQIVVPSLQPSRVPVFEPPPRVKLVGIVWGQQHRTALVSPQAGPGSRALHEGDNIDGWLVKTIARDGIVFEQAGRDVNLSFPRVQQHAR